LNASARSPFSGLLVPLTLFTLFALAVPVRPQESPIFVLGFDCPRLIQGAPGEVVTFDASVTLTSNVPTSDGAEGWQLSLTVEGADLRYRDGDGNVTSDPKNARYMTRSLPGRTLELETLFDHDEDAGTPPVVDSIRLEEAGFNQTFSASHPDGRTGVVSAIVLTELGSNAGRTLPPRGTQTVMRVTVEAVIPEEPAPVVFHLEGGFKGPGLPVLNVVTYQTESINIENGLALEDCITPLRPPVREFQLAVVPPGGAPHPVPEEDTVHVVEVEPGVPSIHELDVILTTRNLPGTLGLEGWQLGIAHNSCAEFRFYDSESPDRKIPRDVTGDCGKANNMTRGFEIETILDHDEDPGTPGVPETIDLGSAGFNRTFCASGVPPFEYLRGMVNAVVLTELGSGAGRNLAANRRSVLMKLLVEMPPVALGETAECRVFFSDFLKGPGTQMANTFTYRNQSVEPTATQGLLLRVKGLPPVSDFIRGDANDDGKLNIADVIRIIFDPRVVPGLGTEEIDCTDAADANADLHLTLADPIYLINWEFQVIPNAPPPPFPFPECGKTEATTRESCRPGSVTRCP